MPAAPPQPPQDWSDVEGSTLDLCWQVGCFSGHHLVSLRPDLIRVLDPSPGR